MKIFRLLLILFFAMALSACNARDEDQCSETDLMPNKNDFPNGATDGPLIEHIRGMPQTAVGRYLIFQASAVYQDAAHYHRRANANEIYNEEVDSYFPNSQFYLEWEKPNFSLDTSNATLSRYLCTTEETEIICRYYALYGSNIIYLQIFIEPDGLSYTDFQKAILAIDGKYHNCSVDKKQ